MSQGLASHLHDVLRNMFSVTSSFQSEGAFQVAFSDAVGRSERELRAAFAPPACPPRRPPQAAIDDLASRKKPIRLPPEGRDPCARAAKLDVVWHSPDGPVPIELKYRTQWNADTYGYMFLKDLHRLERMIAAGGHSPLSEARFAVKPIAGYAANAGHCSYHPMSGEIVAALAKESPVVRCAHRAVPI
jgi:hypothetical protein